MFFINVWFVCMAGVFNENIREVEDSREDDDPDYGGGGVYRKSTCDGEEQDL